MNEAGEQILLNRIKSLEWLVDYKTDQINRLETALKRIAECDICQSGSSIDRMDRLQQIAKEALK